MVGSDEHVSTGGGRHVVGGRGQACEGRRARTRGFRADTMELVMYHLREVTHIHTHTHT